jgi:hypothetical protein
MSVDKRPYKPARYHYIKNPDTYMCQLRETPFGTFECIYNAESRCPYREKIPEPKTT